MWNSFIQSIWDYDKQLVKFVYEAFKKLRPGIPLKCLHGRMKQNVDCPEDIPAYIHRVGRTARFTSEGKSVLFLLPSEKEMFTKLQAVEPKIPIQLKKTRQKASIETIHEQEKGFKNGSKVVNREMQSIGGSNMEIEDDVLLPKETSLIDSEGTKSAELATRVLKKKKLKINVHRPLGTRVKYDEEGNVIPPLAALADIDSGDGALHPDKVKERYAKLREEMKERDKEDKLLHRQRLRDRRTKEKIKLKRWREGEEEDTEDGRSESDDTVKGKPKRSKIYFDSDDDDDEKGKENVGVSADSISIAEQEALALKLLSSMHS
ncbi:putative DEAD-box ATP-dependent RNA helicase 32 [Cocos nucifera]|uniref:Putative DEAD-box ATP-dependent RNA helicase 32 n=1 Tax=Cocos nucifera TaxID=13894 RepID=A0A8K0IY83_COCNU|nr:putative DEAD-box ATP-dependent RNA helicase 32 [Cocos nucifera]